MTRRIVVGAAMVAMACVGTLVASGALAGTSEPNLSASGLSNRYSALEGPGGADGLDVVAPAEAESAAKDPAALILVDGPGRMVNARTIRSAGTRGSTRLWLASGTDGDLCILIHSKGPLAARGPATACAKDRAGGVSIAQPVDEGVWALAGAVPDGVERVNLTLENGQEVATTVERNAYSIKASALATEATTKIGDRDYVLFSRKR